MMKKYWRKMMALTCAAAMLFTMAGCGNAEGTTDGAETAQSSTTADGSGEITIQFAEHVADIQAQEPHLQKIITAFEESHPGIKIDITGKEVSEHNTQMTLLAGENKLPDVFWLEQATAKEFAQNGYLYDLTDALDQYGINDSLLPGLVHSCTVDGKDVGMPSEVMMVGFYYNKDLFQQAGIEEVPVTYEEFLDAVDKLNAAGITPLTVGAQDNYSIWAFETMLARYGFFEKLDGLKDGSISWNNEDFIHYFEKVEEMREKELSQRTFPILDILKQKSSSWVEMQQCSIPEHGISVILREVIWLLKSDFSGDLPFPTVSMSSRSESRHPAVFM